MPKCGPAFPAVIDLTEPSPPRPKSAVLLDAINTAPKKRVRLALRNACDISEEASKMVQEMLLVPVDRVSYKVVEKDVNSDGEVEENGSDGDEEEDGTSGGESDGK